MIPGGELKRLLRILGDLAVALLAIATCVALYRWGVMALLEAVLPLSETQFTVLRRVGVTVALLAAYVAVARLYERRGLPELAFPPLPIALGAASGAVLIGTTILVLFALPSYEVVSTRGFAGAPAVLAAILVAVVFEEVLFRGVLFRLLEKHAGTVTALVVQAAVFGSLHLFNAGTTGVTLVSVTLLGVFWALLFVAWRNLWVVVANHAAWNATIFLSGAPLSGQEAWRQAAPIETAVEGPSWLTGGSFGPEDSAINLAVLACAVAGVAWWAKRRGRFSPT